MRRLLTSRWIWLLLLVTGYLATGFYLVRGNEQAVVRWCGKVQPGTVPAGLHYAWPWPFSRVDRINRNEMRTFTFGVSGGDEIDDSDFLRPVAASRAGEFLTGDKNVLHLLVSVQYRVAEPLPYLLNQEDAERHLQYLTQTHITQAIGASGVDYVHPLGLNELRQLVTLRVRAAAEQFGLGLAVEEVSLSEVRPPIQVKRAFLDVSNARTERQRLINEAQSASERLLFQAQAEARQQVDRASADGFRKITEADSAARRFTALVSELEPLARAGGISYAEARSLQMRRMTLAVLEELWPRFKQQLVIDGDMPIDLLLPRANPAKP